MMSLSLTNLDDKTRSLMLKEVEDDIASTRLYSSPRLSQAGQADYSDLLQKAIANHDEVWLASQLRSGNRINMQEPRRKPSGGTTSVKVPVTAPETLAEGEFNRFYIRGLCRRAEQEGIASLVVYRAKHVENPRPESERKIGSSISAQSLLNDLRNNIGIDTALGLPAGPNSGLSVKLP